MVSKSGCWSPCSGRSYVATALSLYCRPNGCRANALSSGQILVASIGGGRCWVFFLSLFWSGILANRPFLHFTLFFTRPFCFFFALCRLRSSCPPVPPLHLGRLLTPT